MEMPAKENQAPETVEERGRISPVQISWDTVAPAAMLGKRKMHSGHGSQPSLPVVMIRQVQLLSHFPLSGNGHRFFKGKKKKLSTTRGKGLYP